MHKKMVLCFCLTLSGCSLVAPNEIDDGAEKVRIFEDYQQVQECLFITEIVGTQGHWYDYLFISNKDLTLGAMNDLKNEANNVEANSVHAHSNMGFATSVTIFGQAYQCPKNHHEKDK
ncbi:MAG: DUF4156 domain-containing protein [Psychromonas sp.]